MSLDQFEKIEREVFKTLERLGWSIPLSEDEVARAEKEQEKNPVELPKGMEDPTRLLEKIKTSPPVVTNSPSVPKFTEENLARAAREGGEITPDVEERMRQDRKEAEDQSRHGE
jgi:hypothetical protein